MKKSALLILCFLTLLACKKEASVTAPVESSAQLLTKVVNTTYLSTVTFSESINYDYNAWGKIIREGNKTYIRDAEQRIVRILDPGTNTNRTDIQVYYAGPKSGQVAYTLCAFADGSRDSVAYVHDTNGKLVRTASYILYKAAAYIPDTIFLSAYAVFTYAATGNLEQIDFYNMNNGKASHCGHYYFSNYDNQPNPQYATDEIRSVEYGFHGLTNASKNNLRSTGGFTKSYEYRTDGRPRSCVVRQNGTIISKLTFEYSQS